MNSLDEILQRFADQLTEIDQILFFSVQGITREQHAPELTTALSRWDAVAHKRRTADEWATAIDQAEQRATFAKVQSEKGFPVLYSHGIVAIWSALELLAEDIVVASMLADRSLLSQELFRKVKVSVADLELLDAEERVRLIVREVSRHLEADLKQGIGRFEAVLSTVGLAGPIDSALRKAFFEFGALRNVIVHRAGVADRRIAEACPWLNLVVGKSLSIGVAQYAAYTEAASQYFVELLIRDLVRGGKDRETSERLIRRRMQVATASQNVSDASCGASPGDEANKSKA